MCILWRSLNVADSVTELYPQIGYSSVSPIETDKKERMVHSKLLLNIHFQKIFIWKYQVGFRMALFKNLTRSKGGYSMQVLTEQVNMWINNQEVKTR
jgi:hypothetical protein